MTRVANVVEAEACRRSGLLADARARFLAAAAVASDAGDRAALVEASLGAGGLWVHEVRDVVEAASLQALWRRALEVADPDSLEQARLTVRISAEAVYFGEPLEPVRAAVEDVRALDDPGALAEALNLLHHVLLGPEHAHDRLRLADELIGSAAQANDALLALMGLTWRTIDLFLLGAPRAQQSLRSLRERSAAEGCQALQFIAELLDAMLLCRAGAFDDAERASTAAFEHGVTVGDPDAPAYLGAMLAALRWWQGRASEVLGAVREMATSPQLGLNDHSYVAADGLLSASVGDLDAAEEALARLHGVGLDRLPRSSTWLTTQLLVCQAAFLLGDAEIAGLAADQLRPFANLPVLPSLAVVCFGSAAYGLGLAALCAGDADAAIDHLQAALRADRQLGNRPMATLTEHVLAEALWSRGLPDDAARACSLEERAQARAAGIGLVLPEHPPWLDLRSGRRHASVVRHVALERVGSRWRVDVDGRTTVFDDRVGMTYLAHLLRDPGQDLDVLSLVASGHPKEATTPVLDDEALRQYRRRVRELRALLSDGSPRARDVDLHRAELEALVTTLRAATRLDGTSRSFAASNERARTAVRKAILRAIDSIAVAEPSLGDHLASAISTGATCRYAPDSRWLVEVRGPLLPRAT